MKKCKQNYFKILHIGIVRERHPNLTVETKFPEKYKVLFDNEFAAQKLLKLPLFSFSLGQSIIIEHCIKAHMDEQASVNSSCF